MRLVGILLIVLATFSNYASTNGEFCDALSSSNCLNESNLVLTTRIRRTSNICFLCYGQDCLDPYGSQSAEVECESYCYIGIDENGLIIRGCASEYGDTKECAKDENSINQCFTCDGDYCNAILYPTNGRLQCHTCLDEFCQPSEDDVQYCSRYHKDEKCVTIYSPDVDQVETRGCMSDVDFLDECKGNSGNCLMCSTDKCNNDNSKNKIFSCIGCNSVDDPECLRNDVGITKRCATNACYTRVTTNTEDGQKLERGCLADIPNCIGSSCKSCIGTNCNNLLFPENRISCKACTGESCLSEPLKDKVCNSYSNNAACITFFGNDDKVIHKDCYDDVPIETQNICANANNLQCTKCSGSLCNTDNVRRGNRCFECVGIDCFHSTIADIVDCLSDCFVGINQYGETVRGCANKIDTNTLCGNGTSNCMKCSDDLCNGITFPVVNRLSCLSCSGGDCVNIDASKYCEILSPQESCVTVFNSLNQVTERGCLSTIERAEYCKSNQASCLQCQFDNCNVQTSIDQKNQCISCNSKLDSTCVTNPRAVLTVGCKGNCFTRLVPNDNETIERGCMDSITSCLSGSCVSCQNARCNSQTYPTNRTSCFKCIGSDCSVSDLEMKKELCLVHKASENACLTVFGQDSQVILKGCYHDVSKETQIMCDDSSDISCTKCSGNNCNNVRQRRGTKCIKCLGLDCLSTDFPANSVDCALGGCYVGVDSNGITHKGCASSFQNITNCALNNDTEATKSCLVCDKDFCNAIAYPLENRLICMDCYGSTCEEVALREKYCELLHPNERCISIFDSDNKVVERGCLSTIQNAAVCSQNTTNCLRCNTNGCNTQKSRDEMYSCVSCNSKTDPTCTSINSHPNVKACTTNQCYSRLVPLDNSLSWNYIEKGCVTDLSSTNPICTNCTICNGSLCNNLVYPANLFSCRHCSGADCETSTATKYCSLFNQQKQACISVFAERQNVIYRDCYSDAAAGTKDVCDDNAQLACTKCNLGSNCNTDKTRRGFKCYKCSGLDCFTPSHPADVTDCTSTCYVGLNSRGQNVRGCSSSFSNYTCGIDEDSEHQCVVCGDDFCNGITYPISKRSACHICYDSNNCQTPSDDSINYCPHYGEQERCVTVFSADNKVIERGCSSSLNNRLYCSQSYKNCLECSGTGCNNITSINTKMCAVCDSANDPNCVLNPIAVPTKQCDGSCYTRLINGYVQRGCTDDLNSPCTSANNCISCADSDKCNVINYPNNRMECLTCSNSTDCLHPTSKPCIRYREQETCVTIFNGYQVSRKGCLADQSNNDQTLCSANNHTCLTCSFNNCNINNVRPDEKCIICKSDINPSCAQNPQALTSETCPLPSDGECYMKIIDGKTVRGCKGSLSSSDNYICRNSSVWSECLISSGQGSNNKLIPLNRLKCHYCDSSKDADCAKTQNNSLTILPCKNFQKPENCVKISYSDGRVVRGCLADFSSDVCSYGHCETCPSDKIGDGCNFSFATKISNSFLAFILSIIVAMLFK